MKKLIIAALGLTCIALGPQALAGKTIQVTAESGGGGLHGTVVNKSREGTAVLSTNSANKEAYPASIPAMGQADFGINHIHPVKPGDLIRYVNDATNPSMGCSFMITSSGSDNWSIGVEPVGAATDKDCDVAGQGTTAVLYVSSST